MILQKTFSEILANAASEKQYPIKSSVKGLSQLKVSFPKDSLDIQIKDLFRHQKTTPRLYQSDIYVRGKDINIKGKYRVRETKEIEVFGIKKKIVLFDHTFDIDSTITINAEALIGFATEQMKEGLEFELFPYFKIRSKSPLTSERMTKPLGRGVLIKSVNVESVDTNDLIQKIEQLTGKSLRKMLNDQLNNPANKRRFSIEINKEIDKQTSLKKTRLKGEMAKIAWEL